MGSLSAKWTQLLAECSAAGRTNECEDLLQSAIDRVRAVLREVPCPDGWSRFDHIYGRGDTCAVPVTLRDVSAYLCAFFCATSAFCCAYMQWRLRVHGAATSKSAKSKMNGLGMGVMGMGATWCISALLFPVQNNDFAFKLQLGFYSVAVLYTFEFCSVSCQAILGNAANTIFSLYPTRAALWHGRLSIIADFAWPPFYSFLVYGLLTIVAGNAAHDSAVIRRGATVAFLACACVFGCTSCLLGAGAVGTSRALRALRDSTGTESLRKKLRMQRHNAIFSGLSLGVMVIPSITIAAGARRVAGCVWALSVAIASAIVTSAMIPAVHRSVQRIRQRRRSSIRAGAVAPQRLMGDMGVTSTPQPCPVPLARRGVSLSFLRTIAADPRVGAHTTTAEVCQLLVKPATAGVACAFYDILWSDDAKRRPGVTGGSERFVGESDFFLSHTWSYRFQELVAIIEAFERRLAPHNTQYYWFDIFVMNQHSEHDLSQQPLLESLGDAVRAPGRVLLALDSWKEHTPLARVWCLLEIWTAMDVGAEVVMCLSEAEQLSFAANLARNQAEVHRALDAVDAEHATATVDADREVIFGLIRDGTGFEHFNRTIRDALRHSFELVALAAAQHSL